MVHEWLILRGKVPQVVVLNYLSDDFGAFEMFRYSRKPSNYEAIILYSLFSLPMISLTQ